MPSFKRSSAPSAIETRPSVAGDKPTDNKGDSAAVTSPPLSPVPLGQYARENRAMEHDRQKYFKALDRARTKARKAFGMEATLKADVPSLPQEKELTNGSIGRKGAPVKKHHGAQERSVSVGDEREFWRGESLAGIEQIVVAASAPRHSTESVSAVEVKLVDLVQTASVRKGKKGGRGGGLGGDYEFIPHVRSVIVLDDQSGAVDKPRDMDLDDAWEYIGNEDEEAEQKQKPTYATIAAAGMV